MTETNHIDCEHCKYEPISLLAYPCDSCSDNFDKFEPTDDKPAPNNQTAKADAGKPQLTLVPRRIIWAIAKVREYGCKKYPEGGVDNWKQVEKERYRDAMMRHMLKYLDDPDGVDEESGLPHLWHLATNCAFLCEMENGDGTDSIQS